MFNNVVLGILVTWLEDMVAYAWSKYMTTGHEEAKGNEEQSHLTLQPKNPLMLSLSLLLASAMAGIIAAWDKNLSGMYTYIYILWFEVTSWDIGF